jgi:hypothetical protein
LPGNGVTISRQIILIFQELVHSFLVSRGEEAIYVGWLEKAKGERRIIIVGQYNIFILTPSGRVIFFPYIFQILKLDKEGHLLELIGIESANLNEVFIPIFLKFERSAFCSANFWSLERVQIAMLLLQLFVQCLKYHFLECLKHFDSNWMSHQEPGKIW